MLPMPKPEESPVNHLPVLLESAVELLAPFSGATLVDATLGAGGHAELLLEAIGPEGRLIGIDRDPTALDIASRKLARFGSAFVPVRGNHTDLPDLLRRAGVFAADGILLDLGLSSMQIDDASRGFSFRQDGPLDMRMDPEVGISAGELLAVRDEVEIRDILRDFGEERRAGAIARAIVRRRDEAPLQTTGQLAELVERVLGPAARRFRIHPATRTFQALRIAVNEEVIGLGRLVTDATSMLRRNGRLVVISYHSLEDRAVKKTIRGLAERCTCPPRLPICSCGRENLVRVLTGKPVRPDDDEIARNPRSRSARMRAAVRL
jgi:16S rRNA (cytosine1402-N4)-methyltransferase